MVCSHCAQVLEEKLDESGFAVKKIELGELTLEEPVSDEEYKHLTDLVHNNGFEIINDQGSKVVHQIKQIIIQPVRNEEGLEGKLSDYLADKTHKDYQYLTRLFSNVEGKSIDRYYTLQKIERAKELIVYGAQNLTEIAYMLGYRRQQHSSRQFKKEPGLSQSHSRETQQNTRSTIE